MRKKEAIVALCDRWWTELSHSKGASIRRAAEEWLGHLGWTPDEPVFLEGAACGYVVQNALHQRIVFYFTMPGELETPSAVIEKGLDYCETTLMLVGEAQLEKYTYIIITDLNRTYVYDAATDELLLSSDSPRLFVENVLDSVTKEEVDKGSLDEVRRDPASYVARQLRIWCERWAVIFSREPYGSEAIADAIMDRVLVLRFLYDHSICETAGWSYKGLFTDVISSAYEESPGVAKRNLIQLMDELHRVWRCDMFKEEESITRIVSKSQSIVVMLQELALMAKTKFRTSTILESFNYGDASEKARVRLVAEPSEDREHWLGRLGVNTLGESRLEIDVLDEGYRAITHWFDRLMTSLGRVALEQDLGRKIEDCRIALPEFDTPGEMDLFAWGGVEEAGTKSVTEGALDLVDVALHKLFYVWTATDRQRRTARIVLLLHVIEAYHERGYSFGMFPEIEDSFGKRPALLEADKQWIYSGRNENSDEWNVI